MKTKNARKDLKCQKNNFCFGNRGSQKGGRGLRHLGKILKKNLFWGVRAASLRIFEFQICADIVQGTAAATLGLKTFDVLSDKLSPCYFFELKT